MTVLRHTALGATLLAVSAVSVAPDTLAQRAPRQHTTVQSTGTPTLVPTDQSPPAASRVQIGVQGDWRIIEANGVPAHAIGRFPNGGNPHRVESQRYRLRVPARPRATGRATALGLRNFGIAVNGVPFDPGAAEWYRGQRGSAWQYEALSGAVRLGLDAAHAHVQPTGAYHYHGVPAPLVERLGRRNDGHSPLVGWAADGFPIYALDGYADGAGGAVRELRSSWQLREGQRPRGNGAPGGRYDGTFVADYAYVAGSGDLDACNGRRTVTPEFPEGTYAYFLTRGWPVIPRCFAGTPSPDFDRGPARGRQEAGGHRHHGHGGHRHGGHGHRPPRH